VKDVFRKWIWVALAASALAVQAYFVRELLAALILFAALFAVLAAGGLLLYLVQVGGTRAMAVAETTLKSAARAHKHHEPSLRAQ
jgi:hypothetical protein